MAEVRLQKFMAHAGVASRRKSEEIIAAGRVKVNGETVTEMGFKIDPTEDYVEVDGNEIEREKKRYFKLHKPVGVISTASDPKGRKTVVEFVDDIKQRLYPVGRLDYNSSGLILLTNDGKLTHILTHPSFEIEKTYRVIADGRIAKDDIARLEAGVELDDGMTAPARVDQLNYQGERTKFLITIHEGRNRQVRRMCQAVGHEVTDLMRLRFGPIELDNLQPGERKELSSDEIARLKDLKAAKD